VSKVHHDCGSVLESGASGLPYYCTAPVCVHDVLGVLVVWRKNKNKTKKRLYTLVCVANVMGRQAVLCPHNKTKSKQSHTLYAFSYPNRRIERVGGVATSQTKQISTCPGVRNTMWNILLRGDWDLFLGQLEWARTEVGGSTKEY